MEDNPILSRYGPKRFKQKLRETMRATGKGCVHIHDMIDWMYSSAMEMMKDTEFALSWHTYHDAL